MPGPILGGLLLALAFGPACEERTRSQAPPADPEPIRTERPLRVASLTPIATRFVLAVEAGSLLVGVDPESRTELALTSLPAVGSPEQILGTTPDLVLIGEVSEGAAQEPIVRALREASVDVVEFAPHDLEDAIALCRELGERLVGRANAIRFERSFTRPLAEIAGSSYAQKRPRILGIVGDDPPALAGGHSFETDLIEIAGGLSVTHADESPRLAIEPGVWTQLAPDLVIRFAHAEPTGRERRAIRALVPEGIPVAFFVQAEEHFWLDDEPAREVERLRRAIRAASAPHATE